VPDALTLTRGVKVITTEANMSWIGARCPDTDPVRGGHGRGQTGPRERSASPGPRRRSAAHRLNHSLSNAAPIALAQAGGGRDQKRWDLVCAPCGSRVDPQPQSRAERLPSSAAICVACLLSTTRSGEDPPVKASFGA
jgi:hypothetical protein